MTHKIVRATFEIQAVLHEGHIAEVCEVLGVKPEDLKPDMLRSIIGDHIVRATSHGWTSASKQPSGARACSRSFHSHDSEMWVAPFPTRP